MSAIDGATDEGLTDAVILSACCRQIAALQRRVEQLERQERLIEQALDRAARELEALRK